MKTTQDNAQNELALIGDRVYLRPVRESDVNQNYCNWMNDPEIKAYLESRFVTHTVESLSEYVASINKDPANIFLAIVLRESDRHIGNIKLGPIHPFHKTGDIGLIIGEKDCWNLGYAAEAIKLVKDYAFGSLMLRKITAGCYSNNSASEKTFHKAGFVTEGVRRKQYFCDGKDVDHIMMAAFNPTLEEKQ